MNQCQNQLLTNEKLSGIKNLTHNKIKPRVVSTLATISKGKIDLEDVIFFQGYSGWETEQLNDEIECKSWIVIDRHDKNIFDLIKKNSWNKIINELGGKYKIWSNSPDDIYLN